MVFALVGAVVGVLSSLALFTIKASAGAGSKRFDRRPANTDPLNISEWENPANWSAGVFYHSRTDTRLLVPKKLGIGYTLNLGNRLGKIVLLLLIAAALVVLVLDLRK